jgi:hypothetical protein
MLPTLSLEVVAERDIDLLLCEELTVNPDFRRRFLLRISSDFETVKFNRLLHSLCHARYGESDIVIIVECDNQLHAILVENKIDAITQPEQANRYERRGAEGVQEKLWSSFRTCIIAPERYLERIDDVRMYQYKVSYEDIACDLKRCSGLDDARRGWRISCVLQAIEQNRRGYFPKPDQAVTEFWYQYWKECNRFFPDLGFKQPASKPARSTWIRFRPKNIEKRVSLEHKLERGGVFLKLAWGADKLSECQAVLSTLIEQDMVIVRTGKICSLRVSVPVLDVNKPFYDQATHAILAMQVARRIAGIFSKIQEHVRM